MIGALPSPFVTLSPPLGCRAVEGQQYTGKGQEGSACVYTVCRSGTGCAGGGCWLLRCHGKIDNTPWRGFSSTCWPHSLNRKQIRGKKGPVSYRKFGEATQFGIRPPGLEMRGGVLGKISLQSHYSESHKAQVVCVWTVHNDAVHGLMWKTHTHTHTHTTHTHTTHTHTHTHTHTTHILGWTETETSLGLMPI